MTRSAGCLSGSFSATLRSGSFSMLQVMQRPAAEGCEARTEDKAGVDQIGFGDDAFLEDAPRFREIWRDQFLDELRPVSVGLAFHCPAVLPAIDALAGLFAEPTRFHLGREQLRHGDIALRQRLARGETDVEPDRVG